MDETYTYADVEYKRIKGAWHNRAAGLSDAHTWWFTTSPSTVAMLDALHPAPPVQVKLNGVTYWQRSDGYWRTSVGGSVSLDLAAALDRIVELGGAD